MSGRTEPPVPPWVRRLMSSALHHDGDHDPVACIRAILAVAEDVSDSSAALVLMKAVGPCVLVSGPRGRDTHVGECERSTGEGPITASTLDLASVLVPDLDGAAAARSPAMRAIQHRPGRVVPRAVFPFPATLSTGVPVVLVAQRDRTGDLDPTVATVLAGLCQLAGAVLMLDAAAGSPDSLLLGGVHSTQEDRVAVAQGMIVVRNGVNLDAALALIRACAFTQQMDLAEVAGGIIGGRVRL